MSKLAHKLMVGYLRNLTLADGTEYGLLEQPYTLRDSTHYRVWVEKLSTQADD